MAVAAPKAREAAGPASTRQEIAELLLDERRNAALPVLGRTAQKRREVLTDNAVEDGVLCRAWAVGVHRRGCCGAGGHHPERHDRRDRGEQGCEYSFTLAANHSHSIVAGGFDETS